MKNQSRGVIAVLLLLAFPTTYAEVEVCSDLTPVVTLTVRTITDDSDPVSADWIPIGPTGPGTLLGIGGPPHVTYAPETSWPLAVWAGAPAFDHEIAFAEWTGSAWSSTVYLTSNFLEDLDPRVFVEADGTVHVVWWQSGEIHRVYLVTRPAGLSTWDTPVQVSLESEFARRPSVAVFDGELWIGYERNSSQPGMAQDVIVARMEQNGNFTRSVLGSTSRVAELDVMLHAVAGRQSMDWKHSEDELRAAVFQGAAWEDLNPESWTDHTWVGVESTRRRIQQQVPGP